LESGPRQGPSHLQRAFNSLFWTFANLAASCQTELAIGTHVMVADTQVVVSDTHMVVTDTQTIVADTQTIVADIHRNVLTMQGGTSGQNHSVSATYNPSKQDAYHHLDSSQVSHTEYYTIHCLMSS
jgi:hypothetical protein